MQTHSGQASQNGRKTRPLHEGQTHGPNLQDQYALMLIHEPSTMHTKVGPKCKAEGAKYHPATARAILAGNRPTETFQNKRKTGGTGAAT